MLILIYSPSVGFGFMDYFYGKVFNSFRLTVASPAGPSRPAVFGGIKNNDTGTWYRFVCHQVRYIGKDPAAGTLNNGPH